jgi:hypothetical protein
MYKTEPDAWFIVAAPGVKFWWVVPGSREHQLIVQLLLLEGAMLHDEERPAREEPVLDEETDEEFDPEDWEDEEEEEEEEDWEEEEDDQA